MSSFSCQIDDNFEVPFTRDAFRNSAAIEWMHDGPPRFGHSRNVNKFINGDASEQEDYMKGLIASSIAMFCFFFVWIVILIIFKCLGPTRVGFLSGSIMPSPAEPMSSKLSKERSNNFEDSTDKAEVPLQDNNVEEVVFFEAPTIDQAEAPQGNKTSPGYNFEDSMDKPESPLQDNIVEEVVLEAPSIDQAEAQADEAPQDNKTSPGYEQEHEAWQKAKNTANLRLNVMRVIVLFAGAVIIVCAGLMTSKGVSSLVDTLDGGRDALATVHDLTQTAIVIIDTFLERRGTAEILTTELLEETNTFCPNVTEQLCTDILNNEGCNLNGIPHPTVIRSMISYFDGIKGLAFTEVFKFRADLVKIQDTADDMEQKASTFNWAFWVAAAFAIALAVLCFIMMVGVILAWVDRLARVFHCFRMIVIVPLFIALVVVSWIFAMVFVIGSMAMADSCIDSPDGTVLTIVEKYQAELSSFVTEFLIFYISGKSSIRSIRKLPSMYALTTPSLTPFCFSCFFA
jgi:hypothetical protein